MNLSKEIKELELDEKIESKLKENNINYIEDLWKQNKKSLKSMGFSDSQINNIIIKLQLIGISLNKKTNDNDKVKK